MHDFIEELYDLCETLEKDLKKTNEKLRMSGGELTGSDIEYVDKLTHALKSIKTIVAMVEADEDGYSGNSYENGGNRGGRSNRGGSYRSYASYARGRNARRDSRGRYSRDGMADKLRELMENAPDDRSRNEISRLADKIESM